MMASKSLYSFLFIALSLFVSPVYPWGSLAHRTVAYVAEKFLTDNAATFTANLLDNEDISEAALWADELKFAHCAGWQYTKPWHFIDAQDDPPRLCQVKFNRDCDVTEGCVVGAIMNQTGRVNDQSLSVAQQGFALRLLLHFIGDIHQPLHDEAEDKGGNGIKVQFGHSHSVNLHEVWDTSIPEKHAGTGKEDEVQDAKDWADQLVSNADSAFLAADECVDLGNPEHCALSWASEANTFVCSYVLKDGVEGVQGVDLAGDYYEGAVPIVDDLVLKAGKRLGAWVNALAEQNGALGLVEQGRDWRQELRKRSEHKRPKKEHFECPDPNA